MHRYGKGSLIMASFAVFFLRRSVFGRSSLISICSWKSGYHPGRAVGRRSFSPFAWYNKQLERSPIMTKSITSGVSAPGQILPSPWKDDVADPIWVQPTIAARCVLFGSGDVIAQVIVRGKDLDYDWQRTGRALVYGTFIFGPLAHLHFQFLEWLVVRKIAAGPTMMPFLKTFIDQFTYWSAGINTIYLCTLPVLQGKSSAEAVVNVKERLFPLLKANWTFWPLAQIINFKLVPLPHQLNFVLLVSLLWTSYLSWFNENQDQMKLAKGTDIELIAPP